MNRTIFMIILFVSVNVLSALNFSTSVNRFLNEKQQTLIEINYKVPNNQLTFKKENNAFVAPLVVTINLKKGDQVIYTKDFDQTAGAKSEHKRIVCDFKIKEISFSCSLCFDVNLHNCSATAY